MANVPRKAQADQPAEPKKLGRPKLAKDVAKAKIVPVRFAAGELERMGRKAGAKGLNLSQWIRSVVNAAAR